MTRRNRTQEEHATFEEQTSTHIQMIVSAIEASNKELIRTCAKGIFKIFPFFKIKENNKILRECYEDHFIKKFKPELNRRL